MRLKEKFSYKLDLLKDEATSSSYAGHSVPAEPSIVSTTLTIYIQRNLKYAATS